MKPRTTHRAKRHDARKLGYLLPLACGWLSSCVTPITTPDEMRDAVLADRVRDVRAAVAGGFPIGQEVATCFPLVPFAAALGRRRMVLGVLDAARTPDAIDQKNCMGHTALHFAAMTNQRELERDLIARGADRNARDHLERTAEDVRPLPLPALP